jgi:hypothetical protein
MKGPFPVRSVTGGNGPDGEVVPPSVDASFSPGDDASASEAPTPELDAPPPLPPAGSVPTIPDDDPPPEARFPDPPLPPPELAEAPEPPAGCSAEWLEQRNERIEAVAQVTPRIFQTTGRGSIAVVPFIAHVARVITIVARRG